MLIIVRVECICYNPKKEKVQLFILVVIALCGNPTWRVLLQSLMTSDVAPSVVIVKTSELEQVVLRSIKCIAAKENIL